MEIGYVARCRVGNKRMRKNRQEVVIECDICHSEIDDKIEKKYCVLIPFKRSTEKELDVCGECYQDLEDYFREKLKE